MMNIPAYSFFVTFLIMSFIMILRYVLGSVLFSLYCKFSGVTALSQEKPQASIIKKDVLWSLRSSLVFAFFATVLIKAWQEGWTLIYFSIDQYPYWYMPLSLILYLLIHDMYFYWTHRWMHGPSFRKWHIIHHHSRVPTAWTSFAFHPMEALSHAIFLPFMVMIIPVHWSVLGLYLLLMSLFGLTNHLGHELYPRWLEKKLFIITATHHQKHHLHINTNFGLYFTCWDLLMGTELQKDER